MNYTIDIIDMLNDDHDLVYRFAENRSIRLNWNGGDEPGEQNIVGSSLDFTLEVNVSEMEDGRYADMFTGDEQRYKVRLYTDDDVTIWSGYLLPDSYREPYANGTIYVSFTATDGLGRLKDKYLPDNRYEDKEIDVAYLIVLCLQGTQLPLEVKMAPAIVNVNESDYGNIYVNGATDLMQKGKKLSCYEILQKLLGSMLCELYQADDSWYVEGFNKKHKKAVTYSVYNWFGGFERTETVTKLVKSFEGLDTPMISFIPPVSKVVVTETRVPIKLPDTVAQEKNEGWSIGQGVDGQIMPTHWFANGDYLPEAPAPDYKVALRTRSDGLLVFNDAKFLSLMEKLYVDSNQKLVFKGKFKAEVDPSQQDPPTASGMRIEFLLNDSPLYKVERAFIDKEMEIKFDLFPKVTGNLDLRLYQPYFGGNLVDETYSRFVFVEELSLEVVGFEEEVVTEVLVNEGYTVPKEIELELSDDASGFTPCFRLDKLREKSTEYNDVAIPVLYGFQQNGNNYSQVSLYGANLAADNIDSVLRLGQPMSDAEVIYNYQRGDQMVIKTPQFYDSGEFVVRRYRINDGPENRAHWQKWTDTEYPVDRDRYAMAVAKVMARMHTNESERVEYVSNSAVKYNDIIEFNYMLPKIYFPVNVTWDIDAGETQIVMVRGQYANDSVGVGTGNIPPIVNAGADTVLPVDFDSKGYLHTGAEALDPDGFIATYQWTVESGDANANLQNTNSLDVRLVSFAGDEITLRLTVTDSDGETAYDTVVFRKQNSYAISLVNYDDSNIKTPPSGGKPHPDYSRDYNFNFEVDPELKPNETITIRGSWHQSLSTKDQYHFDNWRCINSISIVKNGVTVMTNVITTRTIEKGDFEFNYIIGDDIQFQMHMHTDGKNVFLDILDSFEMETKFEINEVEFQQGGGEVTGYPVDIEASLEGY